jgi:DNA-binding MarR family transcriptional regulator
MTTSEIIPILRAQESWDISRAGLAMLCLLAERGHMRPRDLAPSLGISEAGVNCLGKELVRRSLVKKFRPETGDERAVQYAIREEGMDTMRNILAGTIKP